MSAQPSGIMAPRTEDVPEVPQGHRRCAHPQCANPIQPLANFERMGRGHNRFCEDCWQKRSQWRQKPAVVRATRTAEQTITPGHLAGNGPLVLRPRQPEARPAESEPPILSGELREAIRQRVREIAAGAARDIAAEVAERVAREITVEVVRDVVRELGPAIVKAAVREMLVAVVEAALR